MIFNSTVSENMLTWTIKFISAMRLTIRKLIYTGILNTSERDIQSKIRHIYISR
jgi:hypothetical protein